MTEDHILSEYQAFTSSKAVYNQDINAIIHTGDDFIHEPMQYLYPVLALAEEAGEVAGKVAKYVRKGSTDYAKLRLDVLSELGDVMYNISEASRMFGFTLQDVIENNVEKLEGRSARGTIIGIGDDR